MQRFKSSEVIIRHPLNSLSQSWAQFQPVARPEEDSILHTYIIVQMRSIRKYFPFMYSKFRKIKINFKNWKKKKKKFSQSAGFEPARENPIGFQVQRLNHSATAARYLDMWKYRISWFTVHKSENLSFCSDFYSHSISLCTEMKVYYNKLPARRCVHLNHETSPYIL